DGCRPQPGLDVVRVEVIALRRVHLDEDTRHQRVVGDVPVALPEGRERLDQVALVPDRLDDALDPAAEVIVDLVRLPAFCRAAERIADRGTGEAADGAAFQEVCGHWRSPSDRGFAPGRTTGRAPWGWPSRGSSSSR